MYSSNQPPADGDHANWFKSSYSGTGDNCVETAKLHGGLVGVRDSKNPNGGFLAFKPGEWKRFLNSVKG